MDNLDLDKLRALHAAAGITTLEVTGDCDDGFALCDSRGVCHAVVSFSDKATFLAAIHNAFPALADRLEAAEREREELSQTGTTLANEAFDRVVCERDKAEAQLATIMAEYGDAEDDKTALEVCAHLQADVEFYQQAARQLNYKLLASEAQAEYLRTALEEVRSHFPDDYIIRITEIIDATLAHTTATKD